MSPTCHYMVTDDPNYDFEGNVFTFHSKFCILADVAWSQSFLAEGAVSDTRR